jgi:hypothetical protein
MRLLITSTVGRRDEEDEENGNLLLIFVNTRSLRAIVYYVQVCMVCGTRLTIFTD